MALLWVSFVNSIDVLWIVRGCIVDELRMSCGFLMVLCWVYCRLNMDLLLTYYGFRVDVLWACCGCVDDVL